MDTYDENFEYWFVNGSLLEALFKLGCFEKP